MLFVVRNIYIVQYKLLMILKLKKKTIKGFLNKETGKVIESVGAKTWFAK